MILGFTKKNLFTDPELKNRAYIIDEKNLWQATKKLVVHISLIEIITRQLIV